jgi:hypothetical protein
MFDSLSGVVMKVNRVAALLLACSASLAGPAFAGGYGAASAYRPDADASMSQHMQAAHAKAAVEEGRGNAADENHGGVGGDDYVRSQSGRRAPGDSIDPMYRGG